MILQLFLLLLICVPLQVFSQQNASNVLLYTDPVQVNSSINSYENIVSGIPIQGSIMVTHSEANAIDPNSFRLGDKPLKVEFVQNIPMSSYSALVVSIYSFKLEGLKQGQYTLDPIKVRVGGKEYQAPPMTIQVGS